MKVLSEKRRIFLLSGLGLIAILFLGLAVYASNWTSHRAISRVELDGVRISDSTKLKNEINDKTIGEEQNKISLKNIKETLHNKPLIQKAEPYMKTATGLEVEIKEKIPVAYLADSTGFLHIVDAACSVIPTEHITARQDLILLKNMCRADYADSSLIFPVIRFINFCRENSENELLTRIEEIEYNNKFAAYIFKISSKQIIAGKLLSANELTEKLKTLIHKALILSEAANADIIDLRFSNRIIFRKL